MNIKNENIEKGDIVYLKYTSKMFFFSKEKIKNICGFFNGEFENKYIFVDSLKGRQDEDSMFNINNIREIEIIRKGNT